MDDKTVSFETSQDPIAGLDPLPVAGTVNRPPKKSPARWIIPLAIVLVLLIGGIYGISKLLAGDTSSELTFNHDYIAVLDVNGEISDTSTDYNHAWMMDQIDALMEDDHNKGIFMRVDSPGGSVYTSDEIYYKIMEYKEKTGRPVYSYMGSMAASGGYYISAPCTKIYANRNCWTGSIGVTTGTMFNYTALLEKLGITSVTITSGPNKSMGSSTEEMTEEQMRIMQSLIDEAYDQFVGIVAEGRGMSEADVRKIADGRVMTAKQALKAGLIDGVMNEEDAVEQMKTDEDLAECEMEYLEPPEEPMETVPYFFEALLNKGSSSEFSEILELIQLGKSGSVYTISYMAPVAR